MGLFDFLRSKDERAMPEPGSPEFEAMVQGSALPDSSSVSMGEQGWQSATSASSSGAEGPQVVAGPAGALEMARKLAEVFGGSARLGQGGPTIDLRNASDPALREEILAAMERHGIDAEPGSGQRIDTSGMPRLTREIIEILARRGMGDAR